MPADSARIADRSIVQPDNRDALLRNLVEDSAVATIVAKADGEIIYANRAFERLLGYRPGECMGLGWDQYIHPDYVPGVKARAARLVAGEGAPVQSEQRCLRKDGSALWVLGKPAALFVAGRPLCFTLQALDIDDRKRAEMSLAANESRWRSALQDAGLGAWEYDYRTHRGFLSTTWREMRGLPGDASVVVGLADWLSRIHPGDVERVKAETAKIVEGRSKVSVIEYRERHAAGHWMWVMSRGHVVEYMPDGTAARLVGVDIDITERKNAEEQLQFVNTLLTTQLETSPDAILVVDAAGSIISFNRRFVDMWSVPAKLVADKADAAMLAYVTGHMKDRAGFVERVKYLYAHPEEEGREEIETSDGRIIDRYSGALRMPTGEYLGRVWYFRDVTDRKRADAQILHSARYDGLTGVANRAVFLESIRKAAAVATVEGVRFAVLYLDLDQFKDVNDTLGHLVGDELLKAVAERLRANVRESDIVARFGGDEFAIMAPDAGDEVRAARLADKIIRALASSYMVAGNDIRSGVSVGIALFDPALPDPETILSRADLALYRAKAEGPGVYRFFTPAMESDTRTRVRLSTELRNAIGTDQIYLVRQPQIEIESGRIVGVEALVRWRHPTQGILSPTVFVPVAERSGLIAALGHWVLREACRQAKAWADAGLDLEVMAVNLSTVQFKRAFELETGIVAILTETALPPDKLELELTETVLMAATRDHSDVLQRLRGRGVRVAIDDFGVGYSSLDYLRRFPVDRIKVAQEFVGRIANEPGSAAIVRASIGLARELGVTLVAEGVETREQLDLLRSWGCREAQGFYFAEPLSAEFLTPLLGRSRPPPGIPRAGSAA
jgi:diguanylate cyclase (GGDEF)-like protein/PAS domain S-box-containing protein